MREDGDLVRASRRGDPEAFTALLDRYERCVFNVAFRMVHNLDDARDITQDVFLKIFRNLDAYNPKYRFYSWIYRTAVNESINFLKKNARVVSGVQEQEADLRSPEEAAYGAELSEKLQAALMSVKAEYRAVIVLRHLMDCSYRDIGDILGLPEKTVKSRLFTGRGLLRDFLSSNGFVATGRSF